MEFSEIVGLKHIKNHLKTTADRKRIPHAQLFVGADGTGTLPMAIAYAGYLLCQHLTDPAEAAACRTQVDKLAHPDLHFAFPVANTKTVTSKAKALDFLKEWREFTSQKPYGGLYDWYKFLEVENKQGKMGIDEAKDIAQRLSLKAFGGGYKIMIIWHAETLNLQASNYLLKLIEEPPARTLFILITENESQILQTIRSRCQKLVFPPLGEEDIKNALITREHCTEEKARQVAFRAEGNYAKALDLLNDNQDEELFEKWFIDWVRTAFGAASNKAAILRLTAWSEEIAGTGRETQKEFLHYCLNFIRQALLKNYQTDKLVFLTPKSEGFKLEKFAPFIHSGNILELTREIESAIYHIERNGNSKIILTDLSIKLTRLLHKKEQPLT